MYLMLRRFWSGIINNFSHRKIVVSFINQGFYDIWLKESLHVKHFLIKLLEIGLDFFIFSLCDSEELCDAFFSQNSCIGQRDEFGAEILKVEKKARLQIMVPYLCKSANHCWKNFAHNIIVLYNKLQDAFHILYMLLEICKSFIVF